MEFLPDEMEPFRLELPTGLQVGSVNAYLFTDPEPVLVDTGLKSDEAWLALENGLAQHGLTVSDLSRVIITHAHVDHYGQAGAITANSAADVWISQLGVPWLAEESHYSDQRHIYYRDFFLPSIGLAPETIKMAQAGFEAMNDQTYPILSSRIHPFGLTDRLQLGGCDWQVLHTPGHASMQTCFYDPQNHLLLSADMLLATTPTPVVESPPDGSWDRVPALPLFLQSLDKLEALEVETVFPGHGRPFGNHRALIQRQRERIHFRKDECLNWIKAGYHTPVELLDKMYSHQPAAFRFTGLWMLVGYLDLLDIEGSIRRDTNEGVWHFYPVALLHS
ncbi:MAG: MBL fold metallo-hydrolase [Candidatus Promineifilaceae bacterium]